MLDFAHLDFKFDFYIVNSGVLVLDGDLNVVCKHEISQQTVKEVVDHYQGLMMMVATVDHLYIVNGKKQFDQGFLLALDDVKQLEKETIFSLSLLFKNDDEVSKAKEYLEQFDDLEVYQNILALDIAAKNCSKKSGIAAIADYYQLDKQDIACIGDSYNDISMLEYLDNSYAFDYSPVEVQEVANNIVSGLDECIEDLIRRYENED